MFARLIRLSLQLSGQRARRNYEQDMDQAADDVEDEASQPEHDQ
jgi:hypothetical protein